MTDDALRAVAALFRFVDIHNAAHDLTLQFVEGWVLRVFCDQINVDQHEMNYSITAGENTVAVGAKGRLEAERTQAN